MKKSLTTALIAAGVATMQLAGGIEAAAWVNVTGNLANLASECGNLTLLSEVPNSSGIIAGVAQRGLWMNSGDATWSQLGTGAGSDVITNRPSWIVYDPVQPGVFWESGIYNGGGVYTTADGGLTFRRLGSISHNDYVSVDFTDPQRRTLLAGGHEQPQTVYRSTDGGQSWSNIGTTLPANTKFSSNPLALGAQTYVVNSQGWSGSVAGIYRTTNGGSSWQSVSSDEPYDAPLVAGTTSLYWAAAGGGLLKSSDSGATWARIGNNLWGIHPIQLPDGRLATLSGNTIAASADGGQTWSPIGPTLPYNPAGLIYSARRQAFFIWRWDCGNAVLPDAIMQLDFAVASGVVPPANLRFVASGH